MTVHSRDKAGEVKKRALSYTDLGHSSSCCSCDPAEGLFEDVEAVKVKGIG